MWKLTRTAAILLALMTVLTGVLYPLAVTAVAQLLFTEQAAGSLVRRNGQIIGSRLIGQPFDDPKYFWGRPSATSPGPYNAASSSGSNLAPTSEALLQAVRGRVESLQKADPANTAPIPVDLITASASGLDPHISPAAAYYQAGRVARARGLPEDTVRQIIGQHTEGRQFRLFGESRVNVLELNLALDDSAPRSSSRDRAAPVRVRASNSRPLLLSREQPAAQRE